MKFKLLFILLSTLCLVGCGDDFLDITPESQVSSDNFYKTESDFINGVNAAYSSLQVTNLYGEVYSHMAEVASDNVTVLDPGGAGGREQDEIDRFFMVSTGTSISQFYTSSYSAIQRCNIIVERLPSSTIKEASKTRLDGEVKFIRALMYFNLVRFYGDVPLVLIEIKSAKEGYEFSRTPKAQVYDQIIKDLKDAEANLPIAYTGSNIGRATQGAAKSLLGKVYLTQKNFTAAASKLQEVISSGTYALATVYGDNFDPAKSNSVGHKESIFEIQYKSGGTGEGSRYNNSSVPPGTPIAITGIGNGNGTFMYPTKNIVDAYPVGDLRKRINLDSLGTGGGKRYYCKKYLHSTYGTLPFAAFDGDHNWPVLRYSDVLLMHAEALNEINNGPTVASLGSINAVRRRAFGFPIGSPSTRDIAASVNKQNFALLIEQERRLELAFEGHRWIDLVRTDRAIPVMTALGFKIQPFHILFPIPQSEIDVNSKITQNPGY